MFQSMFECTSCTTICDRGQDVRVSKHIPFVKNVVFIRKDAVINVPEPAASSPGDRSVIRHDLLAGIRDAFARLLASVHRSVQK